MNENSMNNAVTMRPQTGASLGRIDQYELIRELGGGGFGCVYLARDTVAGIEVAVKGLPPLVRLNKEELENVRKNFALVSRLHHPNIAAALHLQKVEKAFYDDKSDAEKLRVFKGDTLVVMQYAPGVTLSQWRKQFPDGKVPLDKALEITRQIASALDYAHKEKILHRDIKPANVMIETVADGSFSARVLDFGLAAEIRSSMSRVSQSITDTSGTRPYMAPEQWLGEEQGKETDQYALAVLFNELVTGKVPFASVFDTGDPVLMMNVVGNREFNPPSELPKLIRRALIQALAKKREDRFGSCSEFVDALEGGMARSKTASRSEVARGLRASSRAFIFTAVATLGLAVGGVWYWQDAKAKEEARIVVEQKADAERKAAEEARRIADEKAKKEKAEAERRQKEEAARIAAEKAKAEAEERARKAEEVRLAAEKKAERNAELEVFRLSSKVKSAHELIDLESSEIKEFFAAEIRDFENNRSSGDEAKEKSKYVITTNFYTQALSSATALKVSVEKYHECKELLPKIERAKEQADEVNASELLPGGYKTAQTTQNAALGALKQKRFDECKEKIQEAESLFVSLHTDVINAVLDIAEGHKNNERWEQCKQEADRVIEWDADNAKAKELKNEALRHLVPSLKVIVTIDGEEVRGAKLNDGQKDYILPTIFKLKQGKKYGPYKIVYERGGKSYKGTFDAVTVNWLGLKTLTMALKQYTAPRHGDRKTLTLPGGETMTMIYVAPGSFMMGSPTDEDGRDNDETEHHVTLTKGYWLGETEVTQAQWESVMGNNLSYFKGASRPVEIVSWEDCQEFIAKVNREARRQLGGEVRLPTEAEWEYACRAGSRTAYSWGNSLNGDKANCDGNYPYGTAIKGPYKAATVNVRSYSPNAWGFYDMHGNVWEWCQDWYGAYPSGAVTDPKGQASGDNRVLRGGGWRDVARCCRSVDRIRLRPGFRYFFCGFRLCCSVGPCD